MSSDGSTAEASLLEIKNLSVRYSHDAGSSPAVDQVDLSVPEGKVVGLVGESGSGKTSIASAILGALPRTASVSGSIAFAGLDLLSLSRDRRRAIKGALLSLIPQNPMTSLNPVLTVGYQLRETITVHSHDSPASSRSRAVEALRQVGVPDADKAMDRYPHEFSGGTRQRILIAAALLNSPRLVIADEPTSALDATVQRQIVELLGDLVRAQHMAMLLISHDMGVIASLSDQVAVMYAGEVVEAGSLDATLNRPKHPYTIALRAAAAGEASRAKTSDRDPRALPTCRFLPRCPAAIQLCQGTPPRLLSVGDGQTAKCFVAQGAR